MPQIEADDIEFGAPAVIEGDYLLPELEAGFGLAVRAVVGSEPDEDQIVANYQRREPGNVQRVRSPRSCLVLTCWPPVRANHASIMRSSTNSRHRDKLPGGSDLLGVN